MRFHHKLDRIIPSLIVQNLLEIIINHLIPKLEGRLRPHRNLETIVFNLHLKRQGHNLALSQHQEVHLPEEEEEEVEAVPVVVVVQHHVLAADKFNH